MSTSSQNNPTTCDKLLNEYGQAETAPLGMLADLRGKLSEVRAEALHEAIEAARGEYLHDDTASPEDEAYNQAVSDVVAAIGALLEGGAA